MATSRRVLAHSLFCNWSCAKNTGILHGPRQNDWAKTRLILAHLSWPSVRNTGVLQCFAAFWAGGCVREFWPVLFRLTSWVCSAPRNLLEEAWELPSGHPSSSGNVWQGNPFRSSCRLPCFPSSSKLLRLREERPLRFAFPNSRLACTFQAGYNSLAVQR